MVNTEELLEQAWQTYERLTRRLESALDLQKKIPPRGKRTTAYAALEGRVGRLRDLQQAARARYYRRKSTAG